MAIQTTIAVPQKLVRQLDTGTFIITGKFQLPATTSGDSLLLYTMPNAGRLYGTHLLVPATLGAGVVAKLQKRDIDTGQATDITSASTAGAAGRATGGGLVPLDFKVGDTIELQTSGGAITAQTLANVEVDLLCQRA